MNTPLFLMAPAPAEGQQGGGGMNLIIMMVIIFLIFYFLIIMPQRRSQKTRQKMLDSVKKGDRVLTTGGVYGTIVGFKANSVILKIDDQVKIEIQKAAITQVVQET